MGAEGRRRAAERYAWRRVAGELEDFYVATMRNGG
jgi:glycosyltransferase involved in cell wall biosynthesis